MKGISWLADCGNCFLHKKDGDPWSELDLFNMPQFGNSHLYQLIAIPFMWMEWLDDWPAAPRNMLEGKHNTSRQRIGPQVFFLWPTSILWHYSQALGSHNFCLQTAVFCIVSFQLWHQRILVASSLTPSSHLNINVTTGSMPVNLGFMAFLGMQSRGNLCTCPVRCGLLNFMQVKIFIFSISYSLYLILHIPFSLNDPNICLEDFPFERVWKVFCFFLETLQVSQLYLRTMSIKVLYNLILINVCTNWIFITVVSEQYCIIS